MMFFYLYGGRMQLKLFGDITKCFKLEQSVNYFVYTFVHIYVYIT